MGLGVGLGFDTSDIVGGNSGRCDFYVREVVVRIRRRRMVMKWIGIRVIFTEIVEESYKCVVLIGGSLPVLISIAS